MRRWFVVAFVAALFLVGVASAQAIPVPDPCDSIPVGANNTDAIKNSRTYNKCRFDRIEKQLDRIEAQTKPQPFPTPTPSPTPTPTPSPTPTPTVPGTIATWGAPVWQTEFNSAADLEKWNIRTRANFGLTFDTAIPEAANVTVEGGVLHVRGKWLAQPEAGGQQGTLTHTTGYIDTRNLKAGDRHVSQRYGRWEVRVKTPTGADTRGALPAFWLRADSHPGEIDIMEAWGYGGTMAADHTTYLKDSAVTTIHSSTNSAAVNGKPYRKTFWRHHEHGGPRPMHTAFHDYAFEYTPTYLAAFVDGKQLFRVTPTSPDHVNGGTMAWLWDPDFFGSPLHMRLNLHVGPSPTYWGLPDPNNRQWTQEPLDYQVDHVRMWALPG